MKTPTMPAPQQPHSRHDDGLAFAQSQQRFAADPLQSVWVEASAGSGKTTVLTQRLLRLVLDGAKPYEILTLTYTTAAASEIRDRINQTVASWLDMDDQSLNNSYLKVCGTLPASLDLLRQRLTYLDQSSQDIVIQTFHAFSTSLLRQFPLEANLAPDFELMDESRETTLINSSLQRVLESIDDSDKDSDTPSSTPTQQAKDKQTDPELAKAINILARYVTETTLRKTLKEAILHRPRLGHGRNVISQIKAIAKNIFGWQVYASDVSADQIAALVNKQYNEGGHDSAKKKDPVSQPWTARLVTTDSVPDAFALLGWGWTSKRWQISRAKMTYDILTLHLANPIHDASEPMAAANVLTSYVAHQCQEKLSLVTPPLITNDFDDGQFTQKHPFVKELLYLRITEAFLTFLYEILANYQRTKEHLGLVDYGDLIHFTSALLSDHQVSAPWVLANLDRKLEHVLIDEAQDTSPQQWRIVVGLVQNILLQKQDTNALPPSLFVVGDFKQSIFSFQGAVPEIYSKTYDEVSTLFRQHQRSLRRLSLGINFRSSPAILQFVDRLFGSEDKVFRHMGLQDWPFHQSSRSDQQGSIIIERPPPTSPKVTSPRKKESGKDFVTALEAAQHASDQPMQRTDDVGDQCDRIARYIKEKSLDPSDILILLPRRSVYQFPLAKALHEHDVPQAASDRIRLGHDGAVLDLRMVLAMALNPYDDFAFACVLRSPLIEWSDDQLFALAHNRETTLYEALRELKEHKSVFDWIENCISLLRNTSIYNFLSRVLDASCPSLAQSSIADQSLFPNARKALLFRHGGTSNDALIELLSLALQHDSNALGPASFLSLLDSSNQDQARENDLDHGQGVKIMTVHAAKGREAPIIILPDVMWPTTRGLRQNMIHWSDGIPIPILNKKLSPSSLEVAREGTELLNFQETLRLLYVVLTRARNHIIVFPRDEGKVGKEPKGAKKDSLDKKNAWWRYIHKTSQQLDSVKSAPLEPTALSASFVSEDKERTTEVAETPAYFVQNQKKMDSALSSTMSLIETGNTQSSTENVTATFDSAPSRQSDAEAAQQRGNLIHSVLATVDAFDHASLDANITKLLMTLDPASDAHACKLIKSEILDVIRHPQLQRFFPSLQSPRVNTDKSVIFVETDWLVAAENAVDLAMIVRPDRICIFHKKIYILDFKSHREPPMSDDDIAPTVLNQMKKYQTTLKNAYPDHAVYGLIVWTNGPQITPLEAL